MSKEETVLVLMYIKPHKVTEWNKFRMLYEARNQEIYCG